MYINKEFRDNCQDEHHSTPPPAFTWRKLTPAKRLIRSPDRALHMLMRSGNKERLHGQVGSPTEAGHLTFRGSPTSM